MSGFKDTVDAVVGTAAVVASAAFGGGPELTATDRYTTATTDKATARSCEAEDPAPSYYDGRPEAGLARATAQMVEAKTEAEKIGEETTEEDRVAEAESSEHSDPPAGSTFDSLVEAAAGTDADSQEGEGDAFAAGAAGDADSDTATEGEGDAFAADDSMDTGDLGDTDIGDDAGDGGDSDGGSDGGR